MDPGKHYQSEKPWLNEVFVKDPVKRGRGLSRIRAGLRRDAAKRIAMAASRLLGAAAACVILLSFAAGSRK